MAKIVIAGNSAVIVSSVKLNDYRKVLKYTPDSLTLYEDEEKKNPIFKVGVGTGVGKVSQYGVEFAAEPSSEGYATITVPFDKPADATAKDYAFDTYGNVITNLNKIEAAVPDALRITDEQKAAFESNVTVAV